MNGAARRRWARQDVLDALREHAEQTGSPPRHADLGKHDLPWAMTIERMFGSLNAALVAAGLPTRKPGRPKQVAA